MPSRSTEIDALIAAAGGLWDQPDAAALRLQRALAIDPESEDALIALYRFLFYRGEREQALQLALQCVTRAASELQLAPDWRTLTADGSAGSVDFADPGRPRHRFYLFSLNAYAYLLARLGHCDEAESVLALVRRLDPLDRIGGGRLLEVIRRGGADED